LEQKLVALVFLVVGSGMVWYARIQRTKVAQSQFWTSVSGQVVRSEAQWCSGPGNTGAGWYPVIEYTYRVDRDYRSDRVTPASWLRLARRRRQAEERCDRYPVGAEVEVFFDPANPSDCCLERAAPDAWILGLFGICFAVTGLLGAVGILPPG
jgi:hypothetical protein